MKPHNDRDEPEGHREGWACQGRTAARPGHQNSAGTPCAAGAPVSPPAPSACPSPHHSPPGHRLGCAGVWSRSPRAVPSPLATSCAQLRLRRADNSIRSLVSGWDDDRFPWRRVPPQPPAAPAPDVGSTDAPTLTACPHWAELPWASAKASPAQRRWVTCPRSHSESPGEAWSRDTDPVYLHCTPEGARKGLLLGAESSPRRQVHGRALP